MVIDSLTMQHPTYWARPFKTLSASVGHHRLIWDLRYAAPKGAQRQYAIAAVYKNTPSSPVGPYVHPGTYTVKLWVDGVVQEKKIEVRLDPRTKVSAIDLQLQTSSSLACYRGYNQIQGLRDMIDAKLAEPKMKWPKGKKELVQTFRGNGLPDNPDLLYGSISENSIENETLVSLQDKLLYMLAVLQSADEKPTTQAIEAVNKLSKRTEEMLAEWKTFKL
jgi:hypothetical protein